MSCTIKRKFNNIKLLLGVALILALVSLRYCFHLQSSFSPPSNKHLSQAYRLGMVGRTGNNDAQDYQSQPTLGANLLEEFELVRKNETLLLRWRNNLYRAEDSARLGRGSGVDNNGRMTQEDVIGKLHTEDGSEDTDFVYKYDQADTKSVKLPHTNINLPPTLHTAVEIQEVRERLSKNNGKSSGSSFFNPVESINKLLSFGSPASLPNILLLSSMGRSGSSFLGGLLNSQPKAFYMFEPLHDVEQWKLLTEENCINSLREIFTCDMKNLTLKAIQKNRALVMQLNKVNPCRINKPECLSADRLNGACQRQPIKVVKTIRTRVSWLPPLLQDSSINLFVIHLVRDPRASLISAWQVEWNNSPEKSCTYISEDLLSGRSLALLYPDRYMMVRYEDICADPWGMARLIFSNLGYSKLPSSTDRFLQYSTGTDKGGSYSIRRKTTEMQQKWRRSITEEQLTSIERGCKSTIEDMGFNLFHTVNATRDFSLPLFSNSRTDKFFLSSKTS